MLDILYENIGAKIKNWAKWIFVVEATLSLISGLIMFTAGILDVQVALVGSALITMVIGPLVAWVSSWLLYAFGELVERVCKLEEYAREGADGDKPNYEQPVRSTTIIRTDSGVSRKENITEVSAANNNVAGGWKCTCGRTNAGYVSSCVCGVSKRDIKLKENS